MPTTKTPKSPRTRLRQAIKNPPLDGINPHFKSKYATLAAVLDVVRAACDEAEVDFHQGIRAVRDGEAGHGYQMVTSTHDGHGTIDQCEIPFTMPADPQKAGSLITYLRRYSLCMLFGIVGEDDDDGNAASTPTEKAATTSSRAAGRPGQRGSAAKPPAGSDADKRRQFWKDVYKAAEVRAGRKLDDDDKPAIFDAVGLVMQQYNVRKVDQLQGEDYDAALAESVRGVSALNFEQPPQDSDPIP